MAPRRRRSILRTVVTQEVIRRGLMSGNRAWLGTFLAFRVLVALKRGVTRQEQFVTIDMLKPGERISVRTIPVKTAKERKQLLKGQN